MKVTVSKVKQIFREQTHIGKYWNVKPRFNLLTGNVTIKMEESEKLVYNMRTGLGKRYDWDGDGCSISDDFEFKIGKSKKNGELTILRIKNYGDSIERMK